MAELDCRAADELAAAYALGALDKAAAAAVRRHLTACDRDHADARSMVTVAPLIAASSEPVEPPAELRDRLMATVAHTPQEHRSAGVAAPAVARPGEHDWLAWLRPALARRMAVLAVPLAVVLAVVAIGLGLQAADRDRALREVAAVLAGGGEALRVEGPAGRGYLVRNGQQATFVAADVADPGGGNLYEMWLIPVDGAPVPAGTFKPEGESLVVAQLDASPQGAAVFAVTVEERRVDAPTSDPVLTVELAQ